MVKYFEFELTKIEYKSDMDMHNNVLLSIKDVTKVINSRQKALSVVYQEAI
jgi:hypothetical protein